MRTLFNLFGRRVPVRKVMEKKILTTKEVTANYPVSRTTLNQWEKKGILKPVRKTKGEKGGTGKNLYDKHDLDLFFFGLNP
jgi:hypothetical protein